MTPSRIAIVGLSALFREGLQVLLAQSQFRVVVTAPTLDEALQGFGADRPDLMVCVVYNRAAATVLIPQLRSNSANLTGIRIVLLTEALGASSLREAALSGVQGVLSREITGDVLQRSLELIMLGQPLFPALMDESPARITGALIPFGRPVHNAVTEGAATLAGAVPVTPLIDGMVAAGGPQRGTGLSHRERQILRCLVEGAANKTIARDLQITEATVKVHIKGLLRKIRVNNRTQAAVWGLNNIALLANPACVIPECSDYTADLHAAL